MAAIVPALVTFALFAYAKHDKRSVYVENGHVLETSDASWSVLQAGIGFALIAAFAGGFLAVRILNRRNKP